MAENAIVFGTPIVLCSRGWPRLSVMTPVQFGEPLRGGATFVSAPAPRSSEHRRLNGRAAVSVGRGLQFRDVLDEFLKCRQTRKVHADHLISAQSRLSSRPQADQ